MTDSHNKEPLSIWFFVGLVLLVYGLIVFLSGLLGELRQTVLAELKPSLWWGGFMVVFGGVFTFFGYRVGRKAE